MKFASHCFVGLLASSVMPTSILVSAQQRSSCGSADPATATCMGHEMDFVTPKLTLHGEVIDSHVLARNAKVFGCCSSSSSSSSGGGGGGPLTDLEPEAIGEIPQMHEDLAMQVLKDAKRAWNGGSGTWPQMPLRERIGAVAGFLDELETQREVIVRTLMWEIGKNRKDAESEFDRTLQFCRQLLETIESDPEFHGRWESVGSTRAFVKRAAIGVVMCLGPMNYPLNETYATLIPALLMGNVCIMKIPTVGGLSHLLTMGAFAKTLPPGTMNFVSGRGRETMPPLMSTGIVDALAFIGGSSAADSLIKTHPHPHRLKVFLQLEAKNMGIFLPGIFDDDDGEEGAGLSEALDQAVLGALSFNGQRCTALKLLFAPEDRGDEFASAIAKRVEAMPVGLPWQTWGGASSAAATGGGGGSHYSKITPLPDRRRVEDMRKLVEDAISKGARILNENGGEVIGGPFSSLMVPAVVYPVTPDMDLYRAEQFGPVVPIATYSSLDEVVAYGRDGEFGQQVSIFASESGHGAVSYLVDKFSSVFGKINVNGQCGRSPDTVPFSGRRSSAMGTMSVRHALQEFSVLTVVSYKEGGKNGDGTRELVDRVKESSRFLEPL